MKQLLTWCGSRMLPEKPSGDIKDANAIMAGRNFRDVLCLAIMLIPDTARAIQQELIDDLANKPELSDWFTRVRAFRATRLS